MNAPVRRNLPIGIQTFAKIREGDYYYVDKTPVALDLARIGGYYFLSRPRRFGKSLFLDTLKELFEGNESLFRGLYIHDRWNWSVQYPVLRISFGSGVVKNQEALHNIIHGQLSSHEEHFQLPARFNDLPNRFRDLIERLHIKMGQPVVILVDEYDKPILDNLTDRQTALAMRDGLRNIYSVDLFPNNFPVFSHIFQCLAICYHLLLKILIFRQGVRIDFFGSAPISGLGVP